MEQCVERRFVGGALSHFCRHLSSALAGAADQDRLLRSSKCELHKRAHTHTPHIRATTSGYLDLVQRLEFGVDHLQKNAVYQI